ncbi:hypothetical protein [Streptomyces sp. UNOB3_S3]|uniref:hypothetical protein n=1 Tax=Streptomyces sp. UNOB3_S3 TaxID=2871682 RepID=UPI001E4E5F32|nr:hypothetical protein [Streptomyces sp. UNOB3_S3]MCC3777634.1 hypothetical protein [Streptomyces sp. UNOB3_S3]
MSKPARIIIHPPLASGGRQVTIGAEFLGVAYGIVDVLEYLGRAGLDMNDLRLEDPSLVEWREGGPGVWSRPEDV